MELILIIIGIGFYYFFLLIKDSILLKKIKPKLEYFEKKQNELNKGLIKLNDEKSKFETNKEKVEKELKEKYEKIKQDLENIYREKSIGIPILAKAYSEYFYLLDLKDSDFIKNKKNPAKLASDTVKKIGKEKEKLLRENKILEYKIGYYEGLFPWLSKLNIKDDNGKIPIYEENSSEVKKYIELKEYRKYWEYIQNAKVENELKRWEEEWEYIKNKEKKNLEEEKNKLKKEIEKLNSTLINLKTEFNKEKQEWNENRKNDLKKINKQKEGLKKDIEYEKNKAKIELNKIAIEKSMGFPWLASAFADYFTLKDIKNIDFLKNKNKPALKTAEILSEIKKEKKNLIRENKVLEYKLNYLQTLFPWLSDLITESEDDLIPVSIFNEDDNNDEDNNDRIKKYLTEEQYKKLPSIERNQLALDRYIESRNKSKWAIGRDYEMYVGYLYSKKGYSIEYKGIIDGFDDLGRDIIAKKGNETCIIQCKNWAKYKEIHEKHIFQLFGTTIEYWIEHFSNNKIKKFEDWSKFLNNFKLRAIFFTSTKLSDRAKKIAKTLNIEIIENEPLGEFPRIKCNIGKDEYNKKTKIYHLPMDQQYDKIKIGTNKEDFFAFTVEEAEKKGFRRAFKYNLNKK